MTKYLYSTPTHRTSQIKVLISVYNQNPKPKLVPFFPSSSHFLHCCHVASPSSHWVAMSITRCLELKGRIQWKSNGSQCPFSSRHPVILIATQWSLPIQLSRGPKGPSRWLKATSPPQELEVGAHRALYLLVLTYCLVLQH